MGRTLCERWRDGQMANMLSKMALSRCRRSLASQLRLSRVTRTWNHQRFWQPGVLRTQRPTRFLFEISRIRCAQRHNGNLLPSPQVSDDIGAIKNMCATKGVVSKWCHIQSQSAFENCSQHVLFSGDTTHRLRWRCPYQVPHCLPPGVMFRAVAAE